MDDDIDIVGANGDKEVSEKYKEENDDYLDNYQLSGSKKAKLPHYQRATRHPEQAVPAHVPLYCDDLSVEDYWLGAFALFFHHFEVDTPNVTNTFKK